MQQLAKASLAEAGELVCEDYLVQGGSCEDEVQLDEATCTDWISTLSRARRGYAHVWHR